MPCGPQTSRYTAGKIIAAELFTAEEAERHYRCVIEWISHRRKSLHCTDFETVPLEERRLAAPNDTYGRYNFGEVKYPRSKPRGYRQVPSKNKR
jgi:hypothetical protein